GHLVNEEGEPIADAQISFFTDVTKLASPEFEAARALDAFNSLRLRADADGRFTLPFSVPRPLSYQIVVPFERDYAEYRRALHFPDTPRPEITLPDLVLKRRPKP